MNSSQHQTLNMFIPSYLYAKAIGFVEKPDAHQIIFLLLLDYIDHTQNKD
jgi:hypothetical protein